MEFVKQSVLRGIYKPRPPRSHKGDFGSVLIVGGNKQYSGSPALVAMASLRAGADLTCIAAPKRAADIAASFSPDLITYPLEGDFINEKHFKEISKLVEKHDAIVIGNGIGLEPRTKRFLLGLVKALEKPCVIDADGIKMLAGETLKKNFLLTPHSVEFSLLTGEVGAGDVENNIRAVEQASRRIGCTILLKGNIDIVSDGKRTACNRTGNPYMTKGGTGDVLAGISAALMARGVPPFEAACAGAYINGQAGDIAAKMFGESMLATDLIACIPRTIG